MSISTFYRNASIAEMAVEMDRRGAVIERLEAENERLREALTFYADPATYVAIGFFPDSPCGDFIDDFSDDHGDEELTGFRPGKRARAALKGGSNG